MKTLMRKISTAIFACSAVFLLSSAAYPEKFTCGIASGFPPYQFQIDGHPAGVDIDVARLIAQRLNVTFVFLQDDWDHIFNKLRSGKIDFIAGIEINPVRKQLFEFTTPYYRRYDVVFIKEGDRDIQNIEDLYNEIITGDRHSFIELDWEKKGIKNNIRIMQTKTKRHSMELLHSGKTKAAIMPKAVGQYLATQMGFKVKILINPDPGSPVAMAVKKGNTQLLEKLNTALQELITDGKIQALHNKWL